METKNRTAWVIGGVAALVIAAALILYPKLVVTLPNDGADAKPNTFTAVRGQRYTEMFLIGGNAITKDLSANVYNTTGLNGGATTGDSCPAAILDKVDVKELKDQYHVLACVQERSPLVDAGLDRSRDGQGAGLRRHEGALGELAGPEGSQSQAG